MTISEKNISDCVEKSHSRFDLWVNLINLSEIRCMAEVGVWRGDFAAHLLENCKSIEKYYMIDPWRHLSGWNKPANESNDVFELFLSEAKDKTDFAAQKRMILRGKTTDVIEEIPDRELDFAYVDGDHTLKGIAIDLIRLYPKIRVGGWIGGDDLSSSIWQHGIKYEPTFVFPYVLYFAEAVGARIYALPHKQFLIQKQEGDSFAFIDFTGNYSNSDIRNQFSPIKILKAMLVGVYMSADKLKRGIRIR